MSSIAIVTDSDASLPAEIAARYGIQQVPITVHFGQESFATGIDIDDAQLFARVDREGQLPTTSAPSPGAFANAFQAAFDDGAEEIVCFCVSGQVSATYSAALAARDLYPERPIGVVDTTSLTMGQGFIVLAAAEAAAAGADSQQIIEKALQVRDRTHLYASLSTLKYLALSGRIGHLAAGMANLLNIKPILTLRDGKLDLLERVRTQKKAWRRVIALTAMAAGEQPIERMAIVHANALEEAARFRQQCCASLRCPEEILMAELTAGLSVHAGAGMVGVAIVVGD